jgi:hypothetical protein
MDMLEHHCVEPGTIVSRYFPEGRRYEKFIVKGNPLEWKKWEDAGFPEGRPPEEPLELARYG